jgi:uncharacterized coiled-coil protein SlyX
VYSQGNAQPEELAMSEDRLTRIEAKLDQLAEAMIAMARMEEKMITLFKRMDKYDENQGKIDTRLQAVEKNNIQTNTFGYLVDKAVWIILGAAAAFLIKQFGQ